MNFLTNLIFVLNLLKTLIYYKGFSEEEIAQFEECLDRIRKNLEEWQKS